MKISFPIVAVVAIMSGVASAHVFVPSRPLPRIETKASPETSAQPAAKTRSEAMVQPVILSSPITASPGGLPAALGTHRPPVPVLLANRRSTAPQSIHPDAAPPKPADLSTMTETSAKATIERDGYKGVRALSRGPDGVWKARALRGETEVLLSVDRTGNVSAN